MSHWVVHIFRIENSSFTAIFSSISEKIISRIIFHNYYFLLIITVQIRSPLGPLIEGSNSKCDSNSPHRLRENIGGKTLGVRSPLGRVNENKIETSWENSPEYNVSPLKFNSSTDAYRLKENVHIQLQQSFSNKKLKENSSSQVIIPAVFTNKMNVGDGGEGGEGKKCPRGRAPVVSARRVISTRMQVKYVHMCRNV